MTPQVEVKSLDLKLKAPEPKAEPVAKPYKPAPIARAKPKAKARKPKAPKADPVGANVSKLNNRVAALEAEIAALKSELGAQLNIADL